MARNKRNKSITRPVASKSTSASSALDSQLSRVSEKAVGIKASMKLGWLLLIGGLIGFAAAFTLMVEKIALLKDANYKPTCSINPVLSCGSVMITPQAEVFGFPNPLLGVAAWSAVALIGAAILAGARFRGWFWAGLQAGVTFAIVFISWLIFQSLYRIKALCPYCMVVWSVTIPIFVSVTLFNLKQVAKRGRFSTVITFLRRFQWIIIVVWYLVVTVMIAIRFWYFWKTMF